MLKKEDWVVSNNMEDIALGIEAGCQTIYIGEQTDTFCPMVFAPTVEDAMCFISAYKEVT